jgi:Branched-chain amino acid transport protein (AzlD)
MSEAVLLALIVGAVNWGLRYLPMRARLQDLPPGSALGGFLAATGPAAIATLFVAEALPFARLSWGEALPLACGVGAVLAVFAWRRSVVVATLAGSLAFGLASALDTALTTTLVGA